MMSHSERVLRCWRLHLFVLFALAIVFNAPPKISVAQNPTEVASVKTKLSEAGVAFKAKDNDAAKKSFNESLELFLAMVENTSDLKKLDSLKSVYAALSKAHSALKKEKIDVSDLPIWADLRKNKANSGGKKTSIDPQMVSFTNEVAPWLVSKCGSCHIRANKGGFSVASLNALMKGSEAGVVLFAGDASGSRIVETIRTGDMPRGGGKVSPEELATLEKWINAGAKFELAAADIPLANLSAYVTSGGKAIAITKPMPEQPATPSSDAMIASPTGKETVSFSKDIAPIFLANCNGCHVDAMQIRGGLNMNTFAQLIKGGTSGGIVASGNSKDSLLVRKLLGLEGQRMPAGGRPALSEEQIKLVSTWIDEGATFDGSSSTASLATINAKAWADAATYEELMERRKERAFAKWKVAFGKSTPSEASDKDFVVLGNVSENSVKEVLQAAHEANDKVRKALKIHADSELAKGGVTIFAIKGRYDYSEFAKMTEGRSLPASWSSHWRRDTLDVYIALQFDTKDPKVNQNNLTQQLASVWVSQFDETPSWFADGFGRSVYAMIAGRQESKTKVWEEQIATIVSNMKDPRELLDGKMNEEDAAIVGYGLTRRMIDSSSRKQFNSFLQAVQKSHSFTKAFSAVVGPLEPSIAVTLGLPAKK